MEKGFQKGNTPWNKGTIGLTKANSTSFKKGLSPWITGRQHSKETLHKMSISAKNRSSNRKGSKLTFEQRKAISIKMQGIDEQEWIGFISPERKRLYGTAEYKSWRKSVFERDNYTCVKCNHKGYVEADHIKSWTKYPLLRFDINNGRTLCRPCHKKVTWGI